MSKLTATQVASSVHYRPCPYCRPLAGSLDSSLVLNRCLGVHQYSLPNNSRTVTRRIHCLHWRLDWICHHSTRSIRPRHRLFMPHRNRIRCPADSCSHRSSVVYTTQIDRHGHSLHDLFPRDRRGGFLGDRCGRIQQSLEVVPAEIRRRRSIAAGLPASSLPRFIAALSEGDTAALAKVPGITPTIIAQGAGALRQALADSLRIVFIIAAPFGVIACIACCFLGDLKQTMTYRVDAPIEALQAKREHHEEMT